MQETWNPFWFGSLLPSMEPALECGCCIQRHSIRENAFSLSQEASICLLPFPNAVVLSGLNLGKSWVCRQSLRAHVCICPVGCGGNLCVNSHLLQEASLMRTEGCAKAKSYTVWSWYPDSGQWGNEGGADTCAENMESGGLCALWRNGTKFHSNLQAQWAYYVHNRGEGLASLGWGLRI